MGVALVESGQQFGIQVGLPNSHRVHQRHTHALLKQSGDLAGEEVAAFGAVLVRGADDFDSGNQATTALGVVDADLVLVLIGQVGFRCAAVARIRDRRCISVCRFVGADIDLKGGANVYLRRSAVTGWQDVQQIPDDVARPLSVDFVPRVGIIHG